MKKIVISAKIDAARQIIKIWKFVVIFGILSSAAIAVLSGFNWFMFKLETESFIITIIALSTSSFVIGTAVKLLHIDDWNN